MEFKTPENHNDRQTIEVNCLGLEVVKDMSRLLGVFARQSVGAVCGEWCANRDKQFVGRCENADFVCRSCNEDCPCKGCVENSKFSLREDWRKELHWGETE